MAYGLGASFCLDFWILFIKKKYQILFAAGKKQIKKQSC